MNKIDGHQIDQTRKKKVSRDSLVTNVHVQSTDCPLDPSFLNLRSLSKLRHVQETSFASGSDCSIICLYSRLLHNVSIPSFAELLVYTKDYCIVCLYQRLQHNVFYQHYVSIPKTTALNAFIQMLPI